MNLLKTHEEILERLTEVASKETKFEERGQFMNIQKMIQAEIDILSKLKTSYEIVEELDKVMDEIKNVSEVEEKPIQQKYVYGYASEDSSYRLLYINDNNINNVRIFSTMDDLSESIIIASQIGYFPILRADDKMLRSMEFLSSGVETKIVREYYYEEWVKKEAILNFQKIMTNSSIYTHKNRERCLCTNYYELFTNNDTILNAIECFNPENIKFNKEGGFDYEFDMSNEKEELLEAIISAIYLIKKNKDTFTISK